MGAQGDRGVVITTSTFSAGARTEADQVNARIELIDGLRLAALMLRHGVGVQAEATVTLLQLDEDFSESLQGCSESVECRSELGIRVESKSCSG